MTTDKQVAEQLSAQGKTTSQEGVPPQTIIPTFDTIESVVQAAVAAKNRIGSFEVVRQFKEKFDSGKVLNLPKSQWQEAGEWFTSLIIPPAVDGGAGGIIPTAPIAGWKPLVDEFAAIRNLEVAGIIPPTEEQLASRKTAEGVFNERFTQRIFEAEQRRQTVQAEAMVNLAVGVTLLTFGALTDPRGNRVGGHIKVTPQNLADFQKKYDVSQEVQSDGGFIISIKPKEV